MLNSCFLRIFTFNKPLRFPSWSFGAVLWRVVNYLFFLPLLWLNGVCINIQTAVLDTGYKHSGLSLCFCHFFFFFFHFAHFLLSIGPHSVCPKKELLLLLHNTNAIFSCVEQVWCVALHRFATFQCWLVPEQIRGEWFHSSLPLCWLTAYGISRGAILVLYPVFIYLFFLQPPHPSASLHLVPIPVFPQGGHLLLNEVPLSIRLCNVSLLCGRVDAWRDPWSVFLFDPWSVLLPGFSGAVLIFMGTVFLWPYTVYSRPEPNGSVMQPRDEPNGKTGLHYWNTFSRYISHCFIFLRCGCITPANPHFLRI